jgi:hypothetical protein
MGYPYATPFLTFLLIVLWPRNVKVQLCYLLLPPLHQLLVQDLEALIPSIRDSTATPPIQPATFDRSSIKNSTIELSWNSIYGSRCSDGNIGTLKPHVPHVRMEQG